MRELLIDFLDLLGLLLLAAGVAGGLYPRVGLWCLAAAGGVVLGGSAVAQWQARPPKASPS